MIDYGILLLLILRIQAIDDCHGEFHVPTYEVYEARNPVKPKELLTVVESDTILLALDNEELIYAYRWNPHIEHWQPYALRAYFKSMLKRARELTTQGIDSFSPPSYCSLPVFRRPKP